MFDVSRNANISKKPCSLAREVDAAHWTASPRIWHEFLDACRTAQIGVLLLVDLNFCPLARDEFERILDLNVTKELALLSCRLLSYQLDNAFLHRLSQMNLPNFGLIDCMPVDRTTFAIDEEAVLKLCFPDGTDKAERQLALEYVELSDAFYARFVQARTSLISRSQYETFRSRSSNRLILALAVASVPYRSTQSALCYCSTPIVTETRSVTSALTSLAIAILGSDSARARFLRLLSSSHPLTIELYSSFAYRW